MRVDESEPSLRLDGGVSVEFQSFLVEGLPINLVFRLGNTTVWIEDELSGGCGIGPAWRNWQTR
jgi:hypothetical protein